MEDEKKRDDGLIIREARLSWEISCVHDIRREVFVREQGIASAQDLDGRDEQAIHALGLINGEPVATGRVFIENGVGILARIAVLPGLRGHGIARAIVAFLEAKAAARGVATFALNAHDYLEAYYTRLGYSKESEDAMVGHYRLIRMIKSL